MKNLKGLLILFIVFTIATVSNAQTFGLKTGLNLSKIVETDGPFWAQDIKMKSGFHIGVTAEFPISETFAIEPNLLFSTKGFDAHSSFEGLITTINKDSYYIYYVEFPINAIFIINLGSVKVLISTGPYLGYAISGRAKLRQFDESDDKPYAINEYKIVIGDKNEDLYIKRFDFGLNMGVSLEIKSISIGTQYGLGLANISGNNYNFYDTKINNRVIGISIGYKFGRK